MILWFFILMVQAMAFTWVSRARNSSSVSYAGFASVISNGVFFVAQLFLIGYIAKPDTPLMDLVKLGAVYTVGCSTGSIIMHWVSIRWLESGNRKVGA
jgi:hypothetical protein